MSDFRVHRLEALVDIKYAGNEEELGRALGYKDGTFVRQMLRGDRNISEKTVRKIEALPGASGWFGQDVKREPLSLNQPRRSTRKPAFVGMQMALKSVPILTFSELKFMEVANDDPRLSSAPRIAASPETGPRVKAMQVMDDSMSPTISAGDMVHLDPDREPQAGNKVLVVDAHGVYYLREYRLRSGGAFEAAAHNSAHATLHSAADGLRVVAVATHVTLSLLGNAARFGTNVMGALGFLFATFTIDFSDLLMPLAIPV